MMLHLRVLWSRMRTTPVPTVLRLTGLTLAVLLAAVIPTFVAASMEGVLKTRLRSVEDPLTLVVGWSAPDLADYSRQLAVLDEYLERTFPAAAGFSRADVAKVASTGQAAVQVVGADGRVQAARRYFKVAPLPDGITVVRGRLPAEGQPEVLVPDALLERSGYALLTRLRLPLESEREAWTADVTVVGTFTTPDTPPLVYLKGALDTALLTSEGFWQSLKVTPGEATWAVELPADELRPAGVATLVSALDQVYPRLVGVLPDADLVSTPRVWLLNFLEEMEETQRFLLVLLTPVFLLVIFFIVATAEVVVAHRRVEIAVLRSRGATSLQVLAFYVLESVTLAGAAVGAGLFLTPWVVRVMGLTAGFLQLVGRPPLIATITQDTVGYAVAAAVLGEAAALVPLARATPFTVSTMRQEAARRSVALAAARGFMEAILAAVVAYGTWRMWTEGAASDPLFFVLPPLALVTAGLVALRLFTLALTLADAALRRWLTPAFYLTLSLLRSQSGRNHSLSLMLIITVGLGIYGAAFARTLDRDLVAQAQYRVGTDLVLKTDWQPEVVSYDAEGLPEEMIYHEPPYDDFRDLPGAAAIAPVQLRREVGLAIGTRNLGRLDVLALSPQEFSRVARFWREVTPLHPFEYLNLLAAEERAVLISSALAQRTNLKAGDQVRLSHQGGEAAVQVAAVVPYWPGRLPKDGEFIVANLHYVQDFLGLFPYDIWVRLEPGASLAPLFTELQNRGVLLVGASDSRNEVASGRRQPFRLGIYGTLSAGFVVAVLVMALTYLLSVGLTLQSRAKEYGVLHAMGMTPGRLALSLYAEQLVIVVTAASIGLLAGGYVSDIFVPMLRQQAEPLLPLKVATEGSDRTYLLAGLGAALLIGAAIVTVWLKRLNVGAVLRLGEEG